MAKKKEQPKRETLEDAAKLGGSGKFLGWEKLPHEPIMIGRFADGAIVYRGTKKAWVFGKAS